MSASGEPLSFDEIAALEESIDAATVAALYGPLPLWFPEPLLPRVVQAIASLRAAGQSIGLIVQTVDGARKGKIEVPGSVTLDAVDFIKSANFLAHVQWALALQKAEAISALAGSRAAQSFRWARSGNDAGRENATGKHNQVSARAKELQAKNPKLSRNAVATKLAPEFGLTVRHVMRILAKQGNKTP